MNPVGMKADLILGSVDQTDRPIKQGIKEKEWQSILSHLILAHNGDMIYQMNPLLRIRLSRLS